MNTFRVALIVLAFFFSLSKGYAADAFSMCNASIQKTQFLINTLDNKSLHKYKSILEKSTTIPEISDLLQLDQNALEAMVPELMKEKNTTKKEAEERLVWSLKYIELNNVDNAINYYTKKSDAGFWQQFLTACMQANSSL
jgi:hypothetical protein